MITIANSSFVFFDEEALKWAELAKSCDLDYEYLFNKISRKYESDKIFLSSEYFLNNFHKENKNRTDSSIQFLNVFLKKYSDKNKNIYASYYLHLEYCLQSKLAWYLKPSLPITKKDLDDLDLLSWSAKITNNDYVYDSVSEILQAADLCYEYIPIEDDDASKICQILIKNNSDYDIRFLIDSNFKMYFKRWM